MPSKKKSSSKKLHSVSNKHARYSRRALLVVTSLFIGVVGTVLLQQSNAARPTAYLIPNSDNKYTASPYNPLKMGDMLTLKPVYKTTIRNPIGQVTCWHLDSVPPNWPDFVNGATQIPTTTPIFSKNIAPLPLTGQEFQIALGTAGSGPAVCQSQFYDGTALQSTFTFGTL